MIRKIGVVCQDRNSFGFLEGIRRRLGCDATLVEPSGAVGKASMMSGKQAKLAALDLRNKGADLIVRFTDADEARWQDVRRHEQNAFPSAVTAILVCGVAVENTEHWLALDPGYVSQALNLTSIANVPALS